ncbi:Putative sideroflexin-1.1 [Toxocara canis]|uniref:Sidoreflexin n=1 Tax=Toxocara canis TaxID=6265 RepID=A0A0B2W1B4_TOXCA|nr:Putative sideroflexin-1.1 [Toxocara canis]
MSELLSSLPASKRPDISKPRWPQNTYEGRIRHYWATANPKNLFYRTAEIEAAQKTVIDYRQEKGLVDDKMTVEELWRRKHIYDSAYHPDTGKKMVLIGRMSAQVPCNMIITGGLLTCYQRWPGLVFWHWVNQSFNAVVNWTNRSGESKTTKKGLLTAYCCATGGALIAALGLNACVKNFHPLINRLVPFTAVAVANAINIPMMRSIELRNGIDVADETGKKLGASRIAASLAIAQVVFSRICMAAPYMVLTPIVAHHMMRKPWYRSSRYMNAVCQTIFCGLVLAFSTPLCCALFPQWSSIEVKKLEKNVQESIGKQHTIVYFNKGL